MGIEIVPKPTKMSFRIEDLAKSSRQEANSQCGDAIVYNVNFGRAIASIFDDENTPVKCKTTVGPMTSTPISVSLLTPNSGRQSKRKRDEVSVYSEPSSIDSPNSSTTDSLVSTGSSSDDERPSKKSRCIFTSVQVTELEKYYNTNKFMAIEERPLLAKRLRLSEQQVKTWFQNRRMKNKRQQKAHMKLWCPKEAIDVSVPMGRMPHHPVDVPGCQTSPITGHLKHQQQFPQLPATQGPMFDSMSFMYGYGPVSPIVYPGYSHHCYNGLSPQPSQAYRV